VRSQALAIGLAAVLGVACGVVTAFALPRHFDDPLHLGAALVNQPCNPGQSVVIIRSDASSSSLSSALETNPGARYLQPAQSCNTTWRDRAPGDTSVRPDPEYVVYLGPYVTNRACAIRMEGTHRGDYVTALSHGSTDVVQCICHVNLGTAPTLRPGMSIDDASSVWIRQLQGMFRDAHLLPGVTGLYDQATEDAVRSVQAKYGPQPTGIVDFTTWRRLARMCNNYA